MRRCFIFVLIITLLFSFGSKNSCAGPLAPIYDLGDNYTLHLGSKATGSDHNIIGLEKSGVAAEGDVMLFALTPQEARFDDDRRSFGFIYSARLQENVTSILSLTDDLTDAKDVVIGFHIHIKLQ